MFSTVINEKTSSFSAFLPLVVAVGMTNVASAAEEVFTPSGSNAKLLKVESGYAVWLDSELITETARHVAPAYTHRFYVQPLDEEKAALVYQLRDVWDRFNVAVRRDGTILLINRRSCHIVPINGEPLIQYLQFGQCLNVYPDGLLEKDWTVRHKRQFQPVYFVPFNGKRLDFEQRVDIVDEGVGDFKRYEIASYPGSIGRHGDTLAWVVDGWLHTLDIGESKTSATNLTEGVRLAGLAQVRAFDGQTVFFNAPYDVQTGKVLWKADLARLLKRFQETRHIFAVRNRIGYFYQRDKLYAVDMTSTDSEPFLLRKTVVPAPFPTKTGLPIWDGKRWDVIPWLESIPD